MVKWGTEGRCKEVRMSVDIMYFINVSVPTQNFLEKSTERETRQEYALAMIQCKVLKQLENLEQQKYDDEDISEDIKFLLEKLGESVQDLRCVIIIVIIII